MNFAARKPQAQPVAGATKKPRATRKATVVENTTPLTEEENDVLNDLHARFSNVFDINVEIKYPLIGMVANLVTTVLGFYSGVQVAAWLGLGAAVFTGSMFLGYVVAVIAGFILTIQALRAGAAVGGYLATGKFETDYQKAKTWITDKFSGLSKKHMAATQGA